MAKIRKFTLGTVFALLIFFGRASVAHAVDTAPLPAPPGSNFAQRLEQRRQERKIVLTPTQQTRLISTCAPAQAKIRLIQTNMLPVQTNRIKVYQKVDAKLWVSIGELKLANKDTFKLEQERLKFAEKTANFQLVSSNFTQTLDDIQVINCKADPAGFQSLVDTARLYYAQLIAQSKDSSDYVVNTVKAELASNVTDLQPKTPSDEGN